MLKSQRGCQQRQLLDSFSESLENSKNSNSNGKEEKQKFKRVKRYRLSCRSRQGLATLGADCPIIESRIGYSISRVFRRATTRLRAVFSAAVFRYTAGHGLAALRSHRWFLHSDKSSVRLYPRRSDRSNSRRGACGRRVLRCSAVAEFVSQFVCRRRLQRRLRAALRRNH